MPSAPRQDHAAGVRALFAYLAGLDDDELADALVGVDDAGAVARRVLNIVGDPGEGLSPQAMALIRHLKSLDQYDFTTWVGEYAQGDPGPEGEEVARAALMHPDIVVRAAAALEAARERAVSLMKPAQERLAVLYDREAAGEDVAAAIWEARGEAKKYQPFIVAVNRLLLEVEGRASALRAARGEVAPGRPNFRAQAARELQRRHSKEYLAILRETQERDKARRRAQREAAQAKAREMAPVKPRPRRLQGDRR